MEKNIWKTHPGNNIQKEGTTMSTRVSVLTILLAVIVAIALFAPGAALAAGTVAGTTISNDATVDYKVGGFSQGQITSAATTFNVDAKVDFTVTANTGATNTVTSAGASNFYYLTFDVFNNSNTNMDFDLAVFDDTKDFDQTILKTVVDTDADNVYVSANDTDLYIDELAPGATIKVFVVADTVAAGHTDGWLSGHILNAVAWYGGNGGTKGWDGANTVVVADTGGDDASGPNGYDWVRADTGNNGWEGASDNFLVSLTALTITKTMRVITDPINGATDPIAIPGATISFTIQIDNGAGGATATEITIVDEMPANLTYTSAGITVINSLGAPGGTFGLTNASDGTENGDAAGEFDAGAGAGTVTVSGITLDAGERTQMIFNATID